MSDNGEIPEKTPMDQRIDQTSVSRAPPFERYDATALGGRLLAETPVGPGGSDDGKLSSWSMAEVERSLSQSVLKPPRDKLDVFGKAFNQKQDFRLRSLSQQLQSKLAREHAKEITSGPVTNRVRGFDLQSQTMRMVTANAALGSYQFQQSQSLPYMRKSLALGYQKVSLLKTIAKGIGSLEKALVSKLEAIKMNTAATAPRKMSFFQKLWLDVNNANRQRIAGNISDFTMDGWSSRYKKHVVPRARKISKILGDHSVSGGINGLRRRTTGAINSTRRTMREVAQNADSTTRSGRLRRITASATANMFGGVAKLAQKVRLGEDANAKTAKAIKPLSDLPGRFNPFSITGYADTGVHGRDNPDETSTLLGQFEEWRKEYSSKTDTIIGHLAAIRGDKPSPKPTRKPRKKNVASAEHTPTEAPKRSMLHQLRDKLSPNKTPLVSSILRDDAGTSPAINDVLHQVRARRTMRRTRFAALRDKVRHEIREAYHPTPTAPVHHPLPSAHRRVSRWSGRLMSRIHEGHSVAPRTKPEPLRINRPHAVVESLRESLHAHRVAAPHSVTPVTTAPPIRATPDRSFFSTMFERLGKRVERVSTTVEDGNRKRGLFERIQMRWKQMGDRVSQSKTRKNSYEDLEAQRTEKKKSLLGRMADGAKGLVKGVGANLAQGNLIGAGGSLLSDAFGWAKDTAADYLTDKLGDKAGDLLERGGRRGRSLLGRGREASRAVGRSGRGWFRRGAGALAEEVAETAGQGSVGTRTAQVTRNLIGGTGRLAGRTLAGTVRLGARAGSAGTKGLVKAVPAVAKGGLKALKVGVPGALKLGWKATKATGGIVGGLARGIGGAGWDLGKAALKSNGLKSLVKGVGPSLVVGLGAHYAGNWLDKHTSGVTHRLGKTATTAAEWGATGAMFGPWGAGIGAAMGAIYENSDLLAAGLKAAGSFMMRGLTATGSAIAGAGKAVWHGLFGKNAVIDSAGKVKEREQQSVFGAVKSALFGAKTKYSKSGDVIRMGQTGLFPAIGHSMSRTIFGEKATYDKTGKLVNKGTPSLLETLKGSFFGGDAKYDDKGNLVSAGKKSFIQRTLASVSKNLFGIDPDNKKSMFGQLKDKFSSVGQDLSKGVGSIIEGIKSGASKAASAVGSAASAVGGAVSDAGQWIAGKGGAAIQGLQGMLGKILEYEGGAKVISDTGGLTKYGISQNANPGVNIRALTEQDARNIYAQKYAAPLGLDKYPPAVGFVALDAAVNQGPGYAKKLLAQGGNDPMRMIQMRRQYYQDLANNNPGKYGQYLKGWNNRMDRLAKDIGYIKVAPGAAPQQAAAAQQKPATTAMVAAGTSGTGGVMGKNGYGTKAPASAAATPAKIPTSSSPSPVKPAPKAAAADAKPVVKVAQSTPAKASASTAVTPSKPTVSKAEPVQAPPKPARAAKTTDVADTSDALSASAKHITNLIASISEQTKAITANTAALGQHGTSMAGYQKAATEAAEATTKTAATIIPVMAQGRAAPPAPANANASPIMGVVMSMAKTIVRTGNHT